MRILYYLKILLVLLVCSCQQKSKNNEALKIAGPTVLDQVVVISNNAPGRYPYMMIQDSVGIKAEDSVVPRKYLPNYGFSYLDDQNAFQGYFLL